MVPARTWLPRRTRLVGCCPERLAECSNEIPRDAARWQLVKDLPEPTVDTPDLPELRTAFSRLAEHSQPRWGRMQSAQMVRHCRVFVELCLGRVSVSWPLRTLAGWLGPLFLRRMMAKSPTVAPKNLQTLKPLRTDQGGLVLAEELERLGKAFDELAEIADPHRHPLYGHMRKVDVIALVRHHTAHHANQFGLLADVAVANGA